MERGCEFAFFSANVQHILGVAEPRVQLELYRQTKVFAEQQAALDLHDSMADVTLDVSGLESQEPIFVVAHHYGYYRLLPLLLLAYSRRICIIVSEGVLAEQRRYYAEVMQDQWADKLLFVTAEDPHLFFKLRQLTQKGYDILCYLDGGAGAKTAIRNEDRYVPVAVLHGLVSARRGFIDMAYLLGRRIALLGPMVGPLSGKYRLDLLPKLDPQHYDTRFNFAMNVLNSVYHWLGERLEIYPQYWEGWLYIHRDMRPESWEDPWPDQQRYIPFRVGQDYYLLDKYSYKTFPLTEEKYGAAWGLFLDYI